MGTVPSEFSDFVGRWHIERDIEDQRAGAAGRMSGWAEIADDGLYHEVGQLVFADQPPLQAERRYHWQAVPGAVEISFADGRPFHHLSLGRASANAEHLCAPDTYLVTYDFSAWPLWQSLWRVHGPRKDYQMTTRYRPS